MRDFLTINQLKAFNENIKPLTESIEELVDPIETTNDTIKFESWLNKPEDIDDTMLNGLVDIQDGKLTGDVDDISVAEVGPNTKDVIMDSIAVAYITRENIPVAFSVISDPTIENWKGVVPLSYYELKSGFNLDGRLQLMYFAVSPEIEEYNMSKELLDQTGKVSPLNFAVIPNTDDDTIKILEKNGYEFKGEFMDTWEPNPVQLWIN